MKFKMKLRGKMIDVKKFRKSLPRRMVNAMRPITTRTLAQIRMDLSRLLAPAQLRTRTYRAQNATYGHALQRLQYRKIRSKKLTLLGGRLYTFKIDWGTAYWAKCVIGGTKKRQTKRGFNRGAIPVADKDCMRALESQHDQHLTKASKTMDKVIDSCCTKVVRV